jgi:hypothetical protein
MLLVRYTAHMVVFKVCELRLVIVLPFMCSEVVLSRCFVHCADYCNNCLSLLPLLQYAS